jgi:hypothetical protein
MEGFFSNDSHETLFFENINLFVCTGSFEYAWIGGIDSHHNGSFAWIDGQPWTSFSESLWNRGENICTEYNGEMGAVYFDTIFNAVKKSCHHLGTLLQNYEVAVINFLNKSDR